MGISRITAAEIFTNSKDLAFGIEKRDGKYAISISRGPGHNFKLLISTEYVFTSRQEAIDGIKDLLEAICEAMKLEFSNPNSFLGGIFNPHNIPLENLENTKNVLRQQNINEICLALASVDSAGTY